MFTLQLCYCYTTGFIHSHWRHAFKLHIQEDNLHSNQAFVFTVRGLPLNDIKNNAITIYVQGDNVDYLQSLMMNIEPSALK